MSCQQQGHIFEKLSIEISKSKFQAFVLLPEATSKLLTVLFSYCAEYQFIVFDCFTFMSVYVFLFVLMWFCCLDLIISSVEAQLVPLNSILS